MQKAAFISSMLYVLLMTFSASVALLGNLYDPNIRIGSIGGLLTTLPFIAFCASAIKNRRGWHLAATTINVLALLLVVACAFTAIFVDQTGTKRLWVVCLILSVPLSLNVLALARARHENPALMPPPKAPRVKTLDGLGGWLILVAIVVVAAPIRIVFKNLPAYYELLVIGDFGALADHSSQLISILIGWAALLCVLAIAWLYALYLFASRKRTFPVWFLSLQLLGVLFFIADSAVANWIFPEANQFDSNAKRQLIVGIIWILIWFRYMRVSERVKSTFVR